MKKSREIRISENLCKKRNRLILIYETASSLVAGAGLVKRLKYLKIRYRFVSTFTVFRHFVSK